MVVGRVGGIVLIVQEVILESQVSVVKELLDLSFYMSIYLYVCISIYTYIYLSIYIYNHI